MKVNLSKWCTPFTRTSLVGTVLIAVALVVGVNASAQESDPHKFAENVKDQLITVIGEKKQYESEGGAEKYIDAVQSVLEPVVDFDWIALAVMGKFREQASDEQKKDFIEVFKRGLVTTYANGMAGFVDYDIKVVPPKSSVEGKERVSVGLEVTGGGSVNRVAFSLKRNEKTGWLMTNMILNGTNFGSLMQKQFAQAMKKNDNNIDAVTTGWMDE